MVTVLQTLLSTAAAARSWFLATPATTAYEFMFDGEENEFLTAVAGSAQGFASNN
jgi:hypothetical protein